MRNSFYRRFGKRIFDAAASACGLVLLAPVFALAALAVRAGGPGPVIFRHRRMGLGFAPFSVYKFRTMAADADKKGGSITAGGDSRVTPAGRLLRKTKIDELPQLFNVLKGEMSLVGPRPEVAEYVELFREDYRTVLSVRPGITDYAAIEYRNEEEVLAGLFPGRYPSAHAAYVAEVLPAKIALYRKYVDGVSFGSDLRILALTLARLLPGGRRPA